MASLAASLSLAAFPAEAGSYSSPTYSGSGAATKMVNNSPTPIPYGPTSSGWGGGSGGVPSASCTGAIIASFTWQPASGYTMTTDPPPTQVVVTETCTASTSAAIPFQTGKYDTGLGAGIAGSPGSVTCIPGGSHNSISGTSVRYTAQPGGPTVTLPSVSPSATGGGVGSSCTVSYAAGISPVFVIPGGATKDSSGNYNILVGQGCTAGLSVIPAALLNNAANPPTYSWSASGKTLQSWGTSYLLGIGNIVSAVYGIGTATNPTAHWYWNDATGAETVSCTATVTPPSGQGSAFSLAPTQPISLVDPGYALAVHLGSVQINNLNPNVSGYVLYAGAGNGVPEGIVFTNFVYTPAPFAVGQGTWGFLQIVSPGAFCTSILGGEENYPPPEKNYPPPPAVSYNGVTGLDTRAPYAGLFNADITGHGTVDGPGIGLSDFYVNYRVNESYSMYVMYTPPGADTITVALTREDWNWQANDNNPGSWANWPLLESAGTIQTTNSVSNPPAPYWSVIVSGLF